MKFNILALSALVFLFNQVFAAPTDASAVEATTNANVNMDVGQTMPETDNALEADLLANGYDKKDVDLLTMFLESVDKFGDMLPDVANLDPASAEAVAEFQESTRKVLADAGYEFRQLDDNRRVLTRVSSETATFQEQFIGKFITQIVTAINSQIDKLVASLPQTGAASIPTKIIRFFANIIKFIGNTIADIFA